MIHGAVMYGQESHGFPAGAWYLRHDPLTERHPTSQYFDPSRYLVHRARRRAVLLDGNQRFFVTESFGMCE
jgi:hypothetical protein